MTNFNALRRENQEPYSPFAGTWIGGIPGDIFIPGDPSERREVTAASGQVLSYYMGPAKIMLTARDVPNPPYFHASLGEYEYEPIATINCRTKYKNTGDGRILDLKDPDMHATALYDTTIQYFDLFSDRPVRYIKSLWVAHDNYDAFYRALNSMTPENPDDSYSDAQLEVAAFETWSGKQAKKQHFTEAIVRIDSRTTTVRTIFRRTDEAYNAVAAAMAGRRLAGQLDTNDQPATPQEMSAPQKAA